MSTKWKQENMFQHPRQRHQYHNHHYQHRYRQRQCMTQIPKMQHQVQLPTLQMLRFLLLLVCYCYHSQAAAMEYSVKLNNCYDKQYGFSGQHIHNQTSAAMATAAAAVVAATSGTVNGTQELATYAVARNITGWKCCCWNATNSDEVECRCEGESLTRVPQTLTIAMQRLTIASAGLTRLRNTAFNVYSASLSDIVLTDLKHLEGIQDGAFASLRRLRTIYISHAPRLTHLSKDVFQGISDTIKIIRIINSGLTYIPDLVHLPTNHILQMIDLDNNHITQIESKSMNIKTDQLILANNDISYIDDSAFYGSQIAKLILKENRKLSQVHPNAFHGMSMTELDLSSTSLVRLPSAGLHDIEVLRIENTHTLKTIPSIYNFKNLQKAFLTHSFHCCAFKFPSRHDPRRHAERLKEIEKWQQQCNNNKNKHEIDSRSNKSKMSKQQDQQQQQQQLLMRSQPLAAKSQEDKVENDLDIWAKSWPKRKTSVTAAVANDIDDDGGDGEGGGGGENSFNDFGGMGFGEFFSDSVNSHGIAWNDGKSQQIFAHDQTTTDVTTLSNKDDKLNLLVNANGILYSRLVQSGLSLEDDANLNDSIMRRDNVKSNEVEYFIDGDDYLSDTMQQEIGVFHDPVITGSIHLEEYCGNFTISKHNVECYPMANALNPCEDVMGYRWLRISVWIVVALAVIGNVAVLVVILSIKSETPSVPRFLMCHLAFADLCLGLYLLLIASIDAHSMGEYFNYAYDWQYGAGCKVAGFLTVFASHLSVFTLTVITIERWLAITHAMYLNHRIKLRPAALIMIGGWIYSMVMSSLPLFGISNYSSTSICLPMEDRDPFDTVYLVAIMGLNGVAFFIIAICYGQIYHSLGKETRHAHSTSRGEMSVAKKMALLVFTNFTCWAPIAFFGLTALAGYPLINVTKSKILLVFFYPLNSCADPYLYAILTSQYRQDLYILLAKFGICKQKAMKYKNSISFQVTTNYTCSIHRQGSLIPKSQQNTTPPETQVMLKGKEDFV